ncbi:alpha/beta fold hydrolase [Pseudomonadales bacterium]|nr:alpha/beta fold hydrolase [Pseudomonadales bacterium]
MLDPKFHSTSKFLVRLSIVLSVILFAASTAQAAYDLDTPMSKTRNGDIEIAYLSVGDEQATPILIVMGLSASHRIWDPALINGLMDGGYRVVLLDNRDTGESSRVEGKGKLWLWWQLLKSQIGLSVDSPYTLADMAGDAVAVLDTLDIEQAHVIGASMGGMIAQIIAYDHPERTKSLTSIMSTTGAPHLPPPGKAQREGIDNMNESSADEAARLEALGFFTSALPNQVTAIFNAGDRTEQVQQISVPTLVLHGADDPLLPLAHGEFTAENIAGSTFKVYQDMAHNMPDEIIPIMVSDMLTHLNAVDNQ